MGEPLKDVAASVPELSAPQEKAAVPPAGSTEAAPEAATADNEAAELPKEQLSQEECVAMLENGKTLLNEDRSAISELAGVLVRSV